MKRYLSFLSLLMVIWLVACGSQEKQKSQTHLTRLTFPDGIYEQGCNSDQAPSIPGKRVLYYFDGDCALCFGKVKTIENLAVSELGSVNLVFIARTARVQMFNRNVLNARIKSCIQIDSLGNFELANPDKTYLDQMAVLDENNNIVVEGNLIRDPDVLSAFQKALE